MTDWIEPKTLLTPDNKQRALVDYIVKNDLLYLKDNASAVTEFTDLSDAPASYTDQGGKVVAVKEDETGLEFVAAGSGSGDMLKSTYDNDDDGRVDKAAAIDDGTHTASATDLEDAVSKKHSNSLDHAEGYDTALGTLGTKDPAIDADKVVYRDSAASDALVTSTWTQIKAFLKTYFDGLYATVANITGIKIDDLTAGDDNTDLDVSSSIHGLAPKAVAPAAGLQNVYGIANGETAITNKPLFDATAPSSQAYGDAATVGSAMVASRRDHKHAMPAIYAHPNHSGDVTSVADGAQTIADKAITLVKMADMATGSLIYRKTALAGAPEVNTLATLKADLAIDDAVHYSRMIAWIGV